ncbi:MAG TPA: M23 family metallopeptidase [Anaerolineales bacterium]|nr:M23 family metallopeptidase [Anaerolineales bacterium]
MTRSSAGRWVSVGGWIVALAAVAGAVYIGLQVLPDDLSLRPASNAQLPVVDTPEEPEGEVGTGSLPQIQAAASEEPYRRLTDLHTIIPERPRMEVLSHRVDTGDSVFGIASAYGITPETVLWANYEQLNDNPDYLEPGMELNIPPVNGVYYQWQEGDLIEEVAGRFKSEADKILDWPANQIDLVNPEIEAGTWVMIPDGEREFRQWIIPTIPRGAAGVSRSVYGPGACDGGYDGAYGTGSFIYPTYNHGLSGNDYWSGHLGIDLAAGQGDGVVAADSGVVVFSGWATGGYGYMVMVDHGNGYQTVYAHLSAASAACGASVSQGGRIGSAGSTGNSTGVHLHFEVRYLGGFISPWFVLPAP